MKVLVVHTHYQQPGGEDQVVAEELSLLRSRGHEVTTFIRHNDELSNVPRAKAARLAVWNRDMTRALAEQLRQTPVDVVHFHNTFPLMSPAVLRIAKASGAAVVQTLHNFRLLCVNGLLYREGSPCERCVGSAIPLQGVAKRCYRDSAGASAAVAAMIAAHRMVGTWRKHVDAFVALSDFARGRFVAGGIAMEKLHVKPNFLATDPGVGDGGEGYLLYVGRLSQEKGVDTLIDAWQQADNPAPLRIVGDGPMADRVRASGAQWLGAMDRDDVMQQMRGAAALVVPSTCYENFPRTIVEAFASSTPVIAAGHGSMAEIVEHGRTGLHFPPGDAGALAKLMGDISLLQPMRAAARQTFEMHYTADRNHELLMNIYNRAISAASDGRPLPRLATT